MNDDDDEFPRHLDLYSGTGGFALAAGWAGFKTIAFVEIDKYCQRVLQKNFADVPIISDARKLDAKKYYGIELITAGFPCQPYSIAGIRRGAQDDRDLWPETRRIIDEARPCFFLGENVPGLVSLAQFDSVPPLAGDGCAVGNYGDIFTRTGRGYFLQILEDLESLDYAVQPLAVPACAVDAKHRRLRLWIMAHAKCDGLARSARRGRAFAPARKESPWSHDPLDVARTGDPPAAGGTVADADAGFLQRTHDAVCAGRDAAHGRSEENVSDARVGDGRPRRPRRSEHDRERLREPQRSHDNVADAAQRENDERRRGIVGAPAGAGQGRDAAAESGRQTVADAAGRRFEQCEPQRETARDAGQTSDGARNLADADSGRLQGLEPRSQSRGLGQSSGFCGGTSRGESQGRQLKSRLGGMAHGLPNWLDDPHPAIPRVAAGTANRVDRLRALGNAIVPQVAYELLVEIRALLDK